MRVEHRFRIAALSLCALFGCNEIAGIHEPIDGDGGAVGTTGGSDPFVGQWTAAIGDQHVECPNGSRDQKAEAFDFAVTTNDHVTYTLSDPDCAYPGKASGPGIGLTPGTTCSGVDDSGNPVQAVLTEGSFRLGDAPNRAVLVLKGTVQTQNVSCSFVQQNLCVRK